MKHKILHILCLMTFLHQMDAQERQFNLSKASCRLFANSLYVCGLQANGAKTELLVYRLDTKLTLLDSIRIHIGATGTEQYLQTSSDTIHGYLNIYLQQKDKNEVTVLRFDRQSQPVAEIRHVEVARLNNTAMLGDGALYAENMVYSVKKENDSSGMQFYLNKYELTEAGKNFDYRLIWQFAFERKNIVMAIPVHADKASILLFVSALREGKNTQWLLKVDATSGKLVKGTRLDNKNTIQEYQFGQCLADTQNKLVYLAGTCRSTGNKSGKDPLTIYLAGIDESGSLTFRQEFELPVLQSTSGATKTGGQYILRLQALWPDKNGGFSAEADIYYQTGNSLCFYYVNSTRLNFNRGDGTFELQKKAIGRQRQIEDFYITADKNDHNGRICADSLNDYEVLYYKPVPMPVKVAYNEDFKGNPSWLLTKSDLNRKSKRYDVLAPSPKVYMLRKIAEIPKEQASQLVVTGKNNFLLAVQESEQLYILKMNNW